MIPDGLVGDPARSGPCWELGEDKAEAAKIAKAEKKRAKLEAALLAAAEMEAHRKADVEARVGGRAGEVLSSPRGGMHRHKKEQVMIR